MRSLLWELRYEFRRRRAESRLRRIEKVRERLGLTLTDMNRCLIMAMPPERREWEARREVMRVRLDPFLARIEEKTGWRYPYGAESDNAHRYAKHRYESDPEGKSWVL